MAACDTLISERIQAVDCDTGAKRGVMRQGYIANRKEINIARTALLEGNMLEAITFKSAEGTLYPILHALEEEGLLTSYWVDVEVRKRKYYHITHKGKRQLKEKREEFKTYSTAVERVLNFA